MFQSRMYLYQLKHHRLKVRVQKKKEKQLQSLHRDLKVIDMYMEKLI